MRKKRKEERGKRKEIKPFLFYLSSFLLNKSKPTHSTKLNSTPISLISLIIKLINPVDKAVDKLWISCG
jgi:hypothetical protein